MTWCLLHFNKLSKLQSKAALRMCAPTLFDDVGFTLDTEDRRSTSDNEPHFLRSPTWELDVDSPDVRNPEEWLNTADCDFDSYLVNLDSPITHPHNAGNATGSKETVNPTGNTNSNPVASQTMPAALKRPVQSEESQEQEATGFLLWTRCR